MRIAINARFLISNKMEGFGRITYEITKRLVKNNPDDTFYLLFDRPPNEEFNFGNNAVQVVISPQARHPFLWYIWFEWSLYFKLKKLKPDAFFSPDGYLSIKSPVKTLLIVHDITFVYFPQFTSFLVRKYYEYFTPKFLNRADRLITLTNHALNDISNYYNIPKSKFHLTTVAAHGNFKPLTDEEKNRIRSKYSRGKNYFLYVGALHPRKNIDRLIEAFDLFKDRSRSEFILLIVGNFMFKKKQILRAYQKAAFKDSIIFLGYLDKDLYSVMGSAHALAYVSRYEGFGMPLVEAMNCHIPSITSNISSMPEVAGNTAILVDPNNPSDIADAMSSITHNKDLYENLKEKCFNRKKLFDWNKTADDVYENIKKMVES